MSRKVDRSLVSEQAKEPYRVASVCWRKHRNGMGQNKCLTGEVVRRDFFNHECEENYKTMTQFTLHVCQNARNGDCDPEFGSDYLIMTQCLQREARESSLGGRGRMRAAQG